MPRNNGARRNPRLPKGSPRVDQKRDPRKTFGASLSHPASAGIGRCSSSLPSLTKPNNRGYRISRPAPVEVLGPLSCFSRSVLARAFFGPSVDLVGGPGKRALLPPRASNMMPGHLLLRPLALMERPLRSTPPFWLCSASESPTHPLRFAICRHLTPRTREEKPSET
jgi:hypothetical protein